MTLSSQPGPDFAYAIYKVSQSWIGWPEYFDIETEAGATGVWIAIGNFKTNRWDWTSIPDGAPITDQPIGADNLTGDNSVYIGVLDFGGGGITIKDIHRGSNDILRPPVSSLYTVGPGQAYSRIEDAYNAAPTSGADILVYPQVGNAPYTQPALQVHKDRIGFWAMNPLGSRVKLDGSGYNYTGAGSVPRAVFQFNADASHGFVYGFEIYGAHNDSYNGAAVRINQANNVSVFDCDIHDCDMGVMSNGSVSAGTGEQQQIEYCAIHGCGNLSDPGYNHNLYLGGTSVLMHGCEVFGSLTGHNIKSRAHFNRIEYCYVHDSANREFDLVDDAENTIAPSSDAVLLGNIIVKDPAVPGNRNVIHFGQDGGNDHSGAIYLIHNTIITPFISPVVALDAPGAGASFVNNIIYDGGSYQFGQVVASASNGASLANVSGNNNWLAAGFGPAPAYLDAATTWLGSNNDVLPFADPPNGNYRPALQFLNITDKGAPWSSLTLENWPDYTGTRYDLFPFAFRSNSSGPYLEPCEEPRAIYQQPDLGAYEYLPLGP